MRDYISYENLTEQRPFRRYVIVAAILASCLTFLMGWVGWQQVQAWTEVGVSQENYESWQMSMPKSDVTETFQENDSCPTDPAAWTLLDIYPGDNYKRIEPTCVYDHLARTVAWHMLARLGYTKSEAAEQLGFDTLPWEPVSTINGLSSTKGPFPIPLVLEWAAHPKYRTWSLDSTGQPGLTYSLRGCYRTNLIHGSQVKSWETYPVICTVAVDRFPGWSVHALEEHQFSINLTDTKELRWFVILGYTGASWVVLGEPQGWLREISNPHTAEMERFHVTDWLRTTPWDADWLLETFDLKMQPLPENWEMSSADPGKVEAITQELNDILLMGGIP
jgi:hypothetical protein